MEKIKKKLYPFRYILVYLFFILIAFLFVAYPLHRERLLSCDDLIFSVQRLHEIFQDVLHFQLPQYDMFSGVPLGTATAIMYPWLFLTIFTPFSLFLSPVHLWCFIVGVIIFIGLLIAFYSFKTTMHMNTISSVFFAIIYCLSSSTIGWTYINNDIGLLLAIIFAPLAFFGWIRYLRYNECKMMIIGLVCMTYSHLVSVVCMLLVLICFTLFNREYFKSNFIQKGIKSLLYLIAITTFVWLPILVLSIFNHLSLPPKATNFKESLNIIAPNHFALTHPFLMRGWSYQDLIAFIIIILLVKYLKPQARIILLTTIGFFLLNIRSLWKFLIDVTPISIIQFSFRFNFIINLVIAWLLTIIIFRIIHLHWKHLFYIIILVIIGTNIWYIGLSNYQIFNVNNNYKRKLSTQLNMGIKHNELVPIANNHNLESYPVIHKKVAYDYTPTIYPNQQLTWNSYQKQQKKIYRFHNIGNYATSLNTKQMKRNASSISRTYARRNSHKIITHFYNKYRGTKRYTQVITIKYRKTLPYQYKDRGGELNIPHNHMNVLIPYVTYNNQIYHIYNNGKLIHPKFYHQGVIQFNNLKPGQHRIKVYSPIMWYMYIAILISIISLIMLFIY